MFSLLKLFVMQNKRCFFICLSEDEMTFEEFPRGSILNFSSSSSSSLSFSSTFNPHSSSLGESISNYETQINHSSFAELRVWPRGTQGCLPGGGSFFSFFWQLFDANLANCDSVKLTASDIRASIRRFSISHSLSPPSSLVGGGVIVVEGSPG